MKSFDLNKVKDFCVRHAEKFVFAGVILGLVFFAYGATRVPRPACAPDDLTTAAENARKHWESTPVDKVLDDKDLRARPYDKIAGQILRPIETRGPHLILDPLLFPERGKREEPQLYPVAELRATPGHGLLAMGGGRATAANIPAGWRWVVLTALIPIADQLKAYEEALGDVPLARPEQNLPMYWYYSVQRAELSSTSQGGPLEWKDLDWRWSWWVTQLYRGSSRQVVDRRFFPQQPPNTLPLLFPLPPLARAEWGNEVAHPPQIPLAVDMPEPERPPTFLLPPGFEAVVPGESDEGEDGDEDEDGDDQFPGFPGFPGVPGFSSEDDGDYGDSGEGYGTPYPGTSRFGPMPFAGPGGRLPPFAMPGRSDAPFAGPQGPFGPAQQPYTYEQDRRGGLIPPAEQQIEYQLFRFFDFWVEPGKRYQYQVQLVLYNPNYKVFVQDARDDRPSVMTEWSDASNVVYVPRDSRLLAGPVEPERLKKEPVANVVAVTFRTKDGLETGGDFEVRRGQLANLEGVVAEQAKTGTYGEYPEYEDYEGYEREDDEGELDTPYRRPGLKEEEGEKFVHETDMLVLDIDGGNRLHRTDGALTEPGSLLLLDPDGNLVVRNELDDMDEFLLYHVPEETKRRKPAREEEEGYEGYPGYYGLGDEDDEGYRRGRRGRRYQRREQDDYDS